MDEKISEQKEAEGTEKQLSHTSCSFTKEGYYAMSWDQSLRGFLPFIIIMEVLFIAFAVYVFLRQNNTTVGIIMCAMVLVYPLILWGLTVLGMSRAYKMNKKLFENAHYEYDFFEEKIAVHFTSEAGKSDTELQYKRIYRVVEKKDYVFIYIQKNQAYILIKKEMENKDECLKVLKEKSEKYGIPYKN